MSKIRNLEQISANDIQLINEYIDRIHDQLASEMELQRVNQICMEVREEIFQEIEAIIASGQFLNIRSIIRSHQSRNPNLFSRGAEQVLFSFVVPWASRGDPSEEEKRANIYTERIIYPLMAVYFIIVFIDTEASLAINFAIVALIGLVNLFAVRATTNKWFFANWIFILMITLYYAILTFGDEPWLIDDYIIQSIYTVNFILVFSIVNLLRNDGIIAQSINKQSSASRLFLDFMFTIILSIIFGGLLIMNYSLVSRKLAFLVLDILAIVVVTAIVYSLEGFDLERRKRRNQKHDQIPAQQPTVSRNSTSKNTPMGDASTSGVGEQTAVETTSTPGEQTQNNKHKTASRVEEDHDLIARHTSTDKNASKSVKGGEIASGVMGSMVPTEKDFVRSTLDFPALNKHLKFGSHRFFKMLTLVIITSTYLLITETREEDLLEYLVNEITGRTISIDNHSLFEGILAMSIAIFLFHNLVDFIIWAGKLSNEKPIISHLAVRKGTVPSDFFFTPPRDLDYQEYIEYIGNYVLHGYITLEYIKEDLK